MPVSWSRTVTIHVEEPDRQAILGIVGDKPYDQGLGYLCNWGHSAYPHVVIYVVLDTDRNPEMHAAYRRHADATSPAFTLHGHWSAVTSSWEFHS